MRRIENLKFKIENCGISFLLRLITVISSLFRPKTTSDDMKKVEFSSSSQRLGVSFTEKIRNIFRYRWIKRN
jgi:hypothetical protein